MSLLLCSYLVLVSDKFVEQTVPLTSAQKHKLVGEYPTYLNKRRQYDLTNYGYELYEKCVSKLMITFPV